MEDESYWLKSDLSEAEADLDRLRERLADAENEAKSLRSQLAASLKLQMDLAEENVRLKETLESKHKENKEIISLRSSNANLEESIRTIGTENNELTIENARLLEALKEIADGDYFDEKAARRIAAKALEGE